MGASNYQGKEKNSAVPSDGMKDFHGMLFGRLKNHSIALSKGNNDDVFITTTLEPMTTVPLRSEGQREVKEEQNENVQKRTLV